MKKVLVAGATGALGRYVLREFKNQGYLVRALTRKTTGLCDIEKYVDEVFTADITDPATLAGVCKGVDVVFSSIGITRQRDGFSYMDVDYKGNANLLYEAALSNIRKFIYVSVFNADKMQSVKVVQAKQRFCDELKKSGLTYSVIYPNGFFTDMLDFLKMADKGRGYLFAQGRYRINPIHCHDLAEVCVGAAKDGNSEIEAGGPDLLTHREILGLAFDAVSKKPRITSIPGWLIKLVVGALKIFTPVSTYGPIEFLSSVLTQDMIAPTYGRHHLKDYFEIKASDIKSEKSRLQDQNLLQTR